MQRLLLPGLRNIDVQEQLVDVIAIVSAVVFSAIAGHNIGQSHHRYGDLFVAESPLERRAVAVERALNDGERRRRVDFGRRVHFRDVKIVLFEGAEEDGVDGVGGGDGG